MARLVFGTTTVTVEGVNFSLLLNECVRRNIVIKKAERVATTTLKITCASRFLSQLLAILQEKGYTITNQKASVPNNLGQLALARIGIIIGLVVGLISSILASLFVWDIVVVGTGNCSEQIVAALRDNGIGRGSFKAAMDPHNIEQTLYSQVDELSLVSVSFRGTSMIINYTERTTPQENGGRKNILATSRGIVASITVAEGTALVKVGDVVTEGQVLIAGYTMVDGEKVESSADGQIFLYLWKSATVEFPLEKIMWVRTGNSVSGSSLSFLGSTLFTRQPEHQFTKFETETITQNLVSSSALPLKITYTTVFELEAVTINQNFEENVEKLRAQAKLLAWEQVNYQNVIEEKITQNLVGNIWFVSHYIKVKEKIN